MKIIKYKLLLAAVPFAVEWVVQATNLQAAIKKARGEIKIHYNLKARKLIEHQILSQKEV
ncbi:MAG: hypothetical protein BWY02_02572 [bacterium ADurb.Bin157]|nr:MAG: hypothetical protein BWY02_02572 [bacterium ADurb.Bin157]